MRLIKQLKYSNRITNYYANTSSISKIEEILKNYLQQRIGSSFYYKPFVFLDSEIQVEQKWNDLNSNSSLDKGIIQLILLLMRNNYQQQANNYINRSMTLNLRKLLSISAQLSFEACAIIRENIEDHSYKKYMKGQDDPVTDADYQIQTMIIKGLKLHFPSLKIIGQQSEQFKGDIDFQYAGLQSDFLPSTTHIDRNLTIQDSCLWIDPIDCTRGFINGNLQDVTILIGLSHKNKPQAGIIGTPYKKKGLKKIFQPIVTIGSVQDQQTLDFNGNSWVNKQKPKPHKPTLITTSNTRRTKQQESFMKALQAKDVRAGGSGRKIMMVANGQADAMVYLESWTHKWDSCAGDAIIKSMGGYFTNPYGKDIIYDPSNTATQNKQGMIAALDKQVFKKCMEAIEQF